MIMMMMPDLLPFGRDDEEEAVLVGMVVVVVVAVVAIIVIMSFCDEANQNQLYLPLTYLKN